MSKEIVYNFSTEETYQEMFGAGLAALDCKANRVPTNTDKAIRYLMPVCDGSVKQKVLVKSEVTTLYTWAEKAQRLQIKCYEDVKRDACGQGQQEN